MYQQLKIKQDDFGGIHVYLDGNEIQGAKAATLRVSTQGIPELSVTLMVRCVDAELEKYMSLDGRIAFEEGDDIQEPMGRA